MKARSGQVIVVLAFVLVALVLLTLLNVDTFMSVRAKNHVQNAGDAAAIAASRKQGQLINEIGRLNVEHLLAVARGDSNKCEQIVLEQRKLALLGPVEALSLANEAAKKNGMKVRDEFSEILRRHVKDIRLVYATGKNGRGEPYPEPFPGAWVEYASKIESVIGEGLAVGPDNIEFYDAAKGHLLLNRQFYHAISGLDWCWFYFNCYGTLSSYHDFRDWNPLPDSGRNPLDNSEIFSLHVQSRKCAISEVFTREELKNLLEKFSDETIADETLASGGLFDDGEQVWFFFEQGAWSRWFDGRTLLDGESCGGIFPLVGEIKEEYNVRGCAAVCRCMNQVSTTAIESTSQFTWSAAAKPFGTMESTDGEVGPVTNMRYLVLPCMTAVRLVPIDAVGAENLATADYGWVTHIREHLPLYMERGKFTSNCFYCLQLKEWERPTFHTRGIRWLKFNSNTCRRSKCCCGNCSGGGGTSHGH